MEVYDDDDSTFDTEYAVDDYYQEYFEWVTEFSEGLAASGESGSGWFYPDPVKEPSGEPFYDEMDDPFYDRE